MTSEPQPDKLSRAEKDLGSSIESRSSEERRESLGGDVGDLLRKSESETGSSEPALESDDIITAGDATVWAKRTKPSEAQDIQAEATDPDSEVTVVSKKPPQQIRSGGVDWRQVGGLLIGKQLGSFRLDELLGTGGMGAVFRATDLQLDRQVAVKVLNSSEEDPEATRRFRLEAQSAARLDHQNIARVFHVGQDQGWNYIVLELVEGRTLRQLVASEGPLTWPLALHLFKQLAAALDHAHQRNIIHRDIKPSNVLVTDDHVVKIVDMGLARNQKSMDPAHHEDEEGVTLGTFDYIAPEQARDPRKADQQSDLYSLGCTLFFALVGRAPFSEGSTVEKLLSHSTAVRPLVTMSRPDLPRAADKLVTYLMAPRREDRMGTAKELERVLVELQVQWRRDIKGLVARRAPRRSVYRVPLLVLTAASLVWFLSWWWDDPVRSGELLLPDWSQVSVGQYSDSIDGLSAGSNMPSPTNAPDRPDQSLDMVPAVGQDGLPGEIASASDPQRRASNPGSTGGSVSEGIRQGANGPNRLPIGDAVRPTDSGATSSSDPLAGGSTTTLAGVGNANILPRSDLSFPPVTGLDSDRSIGNSTTSYAGPVFSTLVPSESPTIPELGQEPFKYQTPSLFLRSILSERLNPENPNAWWSFDIPEGFELEGSGVGPTATRRIGGGRGNDTALSEPEGRTTEGVIDSQITMIQVVPSHSEMLVGAIPQPESAIRGRQNVWIASSLEQAIESLQRFRNVHTIELLFDGAHSVAPLRVAAGSLREIQAGAGFRPLIKFTTGESDAITPRIFLEGGSLELSGIDIVWETAAVPTAELPLAFMEIPAVARLVFQDCTFIHESASRVEQVGQVATGVSEAGSRTNAGGVRPSPNGSGPAATGDAAWLYLNTLPISPITGQKQGTVTWNQCDVQGTASLMNARYAHPMLVRLSQCGVATNGSVLQLGGRVSGTTVPGIEFDMERCTVLAERGLVESMQLGGRGHADFNVFLQYSLLVILDETHGMVNHIRTGSIDSSDLPFFVEGYNNSISARLLWSERNRTGELLDTVALTDADQVSWFRQDLMDDATPRMAVSIPTFRGQLTRAQGIDWGVIQQVGDLDSAQTGVDPARLPKRPGIPNPTDR